MKLCQTAFALVICWCVRVQGQSQTCSTPCTTWCGNEGLIFPGSNGRIVNVAFGKATHVSSGFSDISGTSAPACIAVNGRTSTTYRSTTQSNTNCIHTGRDDFNASWSVDLIRNYTVNDITIYRREVGDVKRRMAGLSVLVDGQLCYSFPNSSDTSALDNLPEKIDVTCSQPLTGRVVRLQKHGLDRNSQFYFINICEVQVWACKDGLYGAQCEQRCSGHCKDNVPCDNYYGTCPTGCTTGTYGNDCKERCGQCADGDTCNTVTGFCPRGCQPGWQGDDCKQSQSQICSAPCTAWCGNERLVFPGSNGRIENVAFGKPASASSGYSDSNGQSAPACIAVNGRTSTFYRSTTQPNTNCIHTGRDDFNASWSVDLIRNYIVINITIYRRQGWSFGRRMAGLSVLVDNQLCYSFPNSSDTAALDNLPEKIDVTCTQPLTGRVVRLQKHGQDKDGEFYFINICEVQVWGCADGIFGSGCSQRCGQCVNSSVCRHDNGFCEQGCSDGYGGILCDTKYASSEDSQNLAGPIAGAVFGGLCVIALSILVVGIYRRRSQQRSQSAQAVAMQGAAIQSGGSDNLAVISHQMTSSAEAANNNVTGEENHYYDELQIPDDSDRAPYSSPVFRTSN